MTKVGSREFKNRWGHYMRRVRKGETLLVTDRGKCIAQVSPPSEWAGLSLDEKLDALATQGHIRRGRGGRLRPVQPLPLRGKPLSEMIIEDRG